MSGLDQLEANYRTVLCDIWGVVHDGARLLPGAAERMLAWKGAGKYVILLTNAPRPASSVQRLLDALGLPRTAYDAIASSGEAGIAALTDPPRPVGFLGTGDDRADLVAHGVTIADDGFEELACTGLEEWRQDVADYRERLEGWAERGVLMHCLNPDRVVIHCGQREVCAGALADMYEVMGGRVTWYGKPHAPIYHHALGLAGDPPVTEVLAIGDGLVTDMLGAALMDIDAVFVSHGIHAGEPIPADFAGRHGLGDWHPLLTVPDLS